MSQTRLSLKISGSSLIGLTMLATMASGYTISGTVLDQKTKPISGVKVFALSDSTQSTLTDSQGRFRLGVTSGITSPRTKAQSEPAFPESGYYRNTSQNKTGAFEFFNLKGQVISQSGTKLNSSHMAFKTSAAIELGANRKYYRPTKVTTADGVTDLRITLEKLPNIVMILSDDQAWTDYGFMGHKEIKTPNLDKLAAQSMSFSRGYVPTSLCRPSILSLSTGLYPHQHGVTGNDPPKGIDRESMLTFIDNATTLQGMLHKQKGYVTLQTGKWWEGNWQRGQWTSGMAGGDRHGDSGLTIGRVNLDPIPAFLDSAGERPFYLWYAPMMPHQPHTPPKRLLDKYKLLTPSMQIAQYWAMVEWFDETIGQVLALLEKKGVRDNTLIVYTTDNGWLQDPLADNFLVNSKNSPFDGGLRTPMIYNWPGKIKPMQDDKTLVSSVDFMPTILAAVGIVAPVNLVGLSLLDSGKAASSRNQVFGEIFFHDVGALHDPKVGLRFRWTIQDRMKLIWDKPASHDSASLYDIVADPFEKTNLKALFPMVVTTLRQKLDAWYPIP